MRKLFLLLAFTGIVSAASATTVVALTKGTVIALGGDDKKQDGKKSCNKEKSSCNKEKACCKSKSAMGSSGCAAAKTEAKTSVKASEGTAEVKNTTATPAPASTK